MTKLYSRLCKARFTCLWTQYMDTFGYGSLETYLLFPSPEGSSQGEGGIVDIDRWIGRAQC